MTEDYGLKLEFPDDPRSSRWLARVRVGGGYLILREWSGPGRLVSWSTRKRSVSTSGFTDLAAPVRMLGAFPYQGLRANKVRRATEMLFAADAILPAKLAEST
jgi:hypothetical protein